MMDVAQFGMVSVVISHELQFVFLGIPRTANRAAHRALLGLPGAFRHGLLHEMGIPDDCQSYFTFCAVRNPYQRLLSWYRWRLLSHPWGSVAENMSFEQYVEATENGKVGPATVRGFTEKIRLDHVYQFEDLPNSLQAIRQIDGLATIKLDVVGNKLSRHWKQFYDQRLADRVFNLCREDFDEFGYDRNSWK